MAGHNQDTTPLGVRNFDAIRGAAPTPGKKTGQFDGKAGSHQKTELAEGLTSDFRLIEADCHVLHIGRIRMDIDNSRSYLGPGNPAGIRR
jgi:hypothetical protein